MRAKPYVTCGLLAGVLTLPISALALGLGKLTVDSSLGQPLSATIELTSAQRDELDTLRARIADPSVYRDNNVQYPAAMARARIFVETGSNGVPYLRVTTSQAVNDPFLDLLVELNWATGRVVRDYTFLLDPPAVGSTQAQAVEPVAPVRAQAAPAAPAAPARDARRTGTAAASGSASGSGSRARSAPAATGAGGDTRDTHVVKRGDTLSKIANEYRPSDVSLEQMLVALFRSNESAFDGKNMNRLRTGTIISIPPADQLTAVPSNEAVKVVKAQAADWRAYRDRVAGMAPASDTTGARQSAGGKITTAVEDKASATQPGKDQLKVSREAGKGGSAAGAAEDAAAKDKALREANARAAELEKTVRELQRAAELKNQTMAALQASADAANAKAKQPATEPPKPIVTAPVAPAPVAPAPAPAVVAANTAPAATTAPAPAPAPVVTPAPAPVPNETKAAETKAGTPTPPAEAPVTPKVAPKKVLPPKPEPSFFEDLTQNLPTWLLPAAGLALVALIIGLFAARRRKTTRFEDSIISGTDIKTNTVFGSTGGGVVNTGENSLASDFSREGLGNIDTDEVDPIAEAEVYLAYGRDAQAEEILKDALKKDSQRQEIYLKLLEIHSQHNKPSAFETVASELYSVSGGQGEVWQKAMVLGRQLDPSNPLFADAGDGSGFAAAASAAEPPAPADTQVFSVAPDPTVVHSKPEPHTAKSLDFSLDDDISLAPTSRTPEPRTPAAMAAANFEEAVRLTRPTTIGGGVLAAGAAAEASAAANAASAKSVGEKAFGPSYESVGLDPESIPKFDLDFQLDEPVHSISPVTTTPSVSGPKPVPEFSVAASGPAPQLSRQAAAMELDKLDLAFDPDRSTFEDPTPSVLDGQWHDAATKLDLAKAYQEMGDIEGAREILQEVIHEGDDQQKGEAKSLLAKLA